MIDHKVNRLPVVEGERLVGIISRADLVRAFRRTDEEIEREIREDVVEHTAWVPGDAVEIVVDGGEVVLRGEVEKHSDARLIERFSGRVPGVVSVRSELKWSVDDLSRAHVRHATKGGRS